MAKEKKIETTQAPATAKKTTSAKASPKQVAKKTPAPKKTAAKKTANKKMAVGKKAAVAKKVVAKKAPVVATRPAAPATPQAAPRRQTQSALPLEEKSKAGVSPSVSAAERYAMIQEAAYYRAEKRNFAPGFDAEDWADAEREINEKLGKR